MVLCGFLKNGIVTTKAWRGYPAWEVFASDLLNEFELEEAGLEEAGLEEEVKEGNDTA